MTQPTEQIADRSQDTAARMTGRGAVLAMFALFFTGAAIAGLLHLGVLVGFSFLAGCVLAARFARRSALLVVVVSPPLIFLIAVACAESISSSSHRSFQGAVRGRRNHPHPGGGGALAVRRRSAGAGSRPVPRAAAVHPRLARRACAARSAPAPGPPGPTLSSGGHPVPDYGTGWRESGQTAVSLAEGSRSRRQAR